jgi:quercetin dioxygenase-like cupin family protein
MEEPILIKKGTILKELKSENKSFQLRLKNDTMEVVVTEMEPGAEFGETYSHEGQEIHMVVSGVIEFEVAGGKYILEEGDWLWHRSDVPHHSRNLSDKKAKYITIGVPPTFM